RPAGDPAPVRVGREQRATPEQALGRGAQALHESGVHRGHATTVSGDLQSRGVAVHRASGGHWWRRGQALPSVHFAGLWPRVVYNRVPCAGIALRSWCLARCSRNRMCSEPLVTAPRATPGDPVADGSRRLISVVSPCYNEAEVIHLFYEELRRVIDGLQ